MKSGLLTHLGSWTLAMKVEFDRRQNTARSPCRYAEGQLNQNQNPAMKKTKRFMKHVLLFGCSLVLGTWGMPAQENTNIAPQAEHVFRAACQYLAEAPFFCLTAEVWREHVTQSGQKLQFSRTVTFEVKRPNRLHVEIRSPQAERGFWYDGQSLTILDRKRNLFSTVPMPGTLDAALDRARDQFGIDLPLADLAVSDPYQNATSSVRKGADYGLEPVLGVDCHHLAFTQENVDWQVWIQDGPQPLIRKFVIAHKNEAGAPQFTALLTRWDLTNRISDSDFVFEPPRGATKVEMRQDRPQSSEDRSSGPSTPLTSPKAK
jgi:hypothetical protein